jgi:hypothetical protein
VAVSCGPPRAASLLTSGPSRTSPSLSLQYPGVTPPARPVLGSSCAFEALYTLSLSVLVRALLSSFIFQHLQIDSRSRPQVLACQSFFLLTLAFTLYKSAQRKHQHQNSRPFDVFLSLLSSGRSFEGLLACISFKNNLRTSIDHSTNLLYRHIYSEGF